MPALTDPNTPYIGKRGALPAGTTGAGAGGTTTKAAPFDWTAFAKSVFAPIDYSGLAKVASGRAASDTDALVAGYQTLQSDALAQASARAAQQGQLGLASSKYLQGLNLGGAAAGDYANAAAAQRAAAAGYSGGLQQTVSDAAAKVQANLAAAGSSQTAVNQGAAAGNALYGLSGNLPAEQLDVIGPTVAAGLRALPAQTLGYGQQLAFGELGAGQQEAAKFKADIVTARAKQGALAASYLDKLSNVARQAGQDRIADYYKALGLKVKMDAASAQGNQIDAAASRVLGHIIYKDGTEPTDTKGNVIPITAPAAKPYRYQDSFGREVQYDPTTGAQTVLSEGHWTDSAGASWHVGLDGKQTLVSTKPVTPHYTTVSDATGTYLINEDTLTRAKVGGPPASAGSSYQDAFGRQIKVNADGTQAVMSPGTWENPVTHATYTVGRDGKFTPLTKGKLAKPYSIPAGILKAAQNIADLAYGQATTIGTAGGFATAIAPTGVKKPYKEALRRVRAYLRGAGVPESLIPSTSMNIVQSAGYVTPSGAGWGGAAGLAG